MGLLFAAEACAVGISENDIFHRLLGYIFYVQAAKKINWGITPSTPIWLGP